jgi:3-oxoisoapionate kinase
MIGFFADDLTGAGDVLARAHLHGLDAALVLDPAGGLPEAADVVGVAGTARSLSGDAFDASVRAGLAPLAALDRLEVLLYKVCSTFDSSPEVGSIGRGIELLHTYFGDHGPVPVVPAQPDFGRYTAFANHFGRSGDAVHRLDRHPVMSRHPVTPMHEADLRRVLSAQLTDAPDVPSIELPSYLDGSFRDRWVTARAGSAPAFVVDAVTEDHMDLVAERLLAADRSVVVGSGGIMEALARVRGGCMPVPAANGRSSGPTLVVSASASAVTAGQIDDALAAGWTGVPVPVGSATASGSGDGAARLVAEALGRGEDVVAYTVRGPDDPAFRQGGSDPAGTGARIGRIAADAVRSGLTRDVVICGGDTAGYALVAAGVNELRVAAQFVPVAPVCRSDGALAGCRLVLKGGQVGPPDLFTRFAGGAES